MRKTLTALLMALTGLLLTACGGGDVEAQQGCREAARAVFADVMAGRITTEEGQARVDEACKDVDAVNRKAILDAERMKAITAPAPTPSAGPTP